jgi:hypothetical protein
MIQYFGEVVSPPAARPVESEPEIASAAEDGMMPALPSESKETAAGQQV